MDILAMKENIMNRVKDTFQSKFDDLPLLVKAPGRINLIGEHTDYNEGFVMPAAVAHGTYFAIGKSGGDQCMLVSLDLQDSYQFDIHQVSKQEEGSWKNYVLGVVAELQKAGAELGGFNLVFSGDVPRGSGMSSSAALECGVAFALNTLFDLGFDRESMVKMAQKAEHNYAGVMCGIMDQFASMMGKDGLAMKLDCRSLDLQYFPIQLDEYQLLLCNSNVSHSLAGSEYNVRRQQCEVGVATLNEKYGGIQSLRDVSFQQLTESREALDPVVFKRCKYVVEENQRLMEFGQALEANDITKAGGILKQAQHAMRHEYEVTCPEIDFMADFANDREDVAGARMMGGGFGGCTLNIVKSHIAEAFIADLQAAYSKAFGKEMTPIKVDIAEGVHLVEV